MCSGLFCDSIFQTERVETMSKAYSISNSSEVIAKAEKEDVNGGLSEKFTNGHQTVTLPPPPKQSTERILG